MNYVCDEDFTGNRSTTLIIVDFAPRVLETRQLTQYVHEVFVITRNNDTTTPRSCNHYK